MNNKNKSPIFAEDLESPTFITKIFGKVIDWMAKPSVKSVLNAFKATFELVKSGVEGSIENYNTAKMQPRVQDFRKEVPEDYFDKKNIKTDIDSTMKIANRKEAKKLPKTVLPKASQQKLNSSKAVSNIQTTRGDLTKTLKIV
jgi:hypothetical protein